MAILAYPFYLWTQTPAGDMGIRRLPGKSLGAVATDSIRSVDGLEVLAVKNVGSIV